MAWASDETLSGMRYFLDEMVAEVRSDGDYADANELAETLTHLGEDSTPEKKVEFLSLTLALAIFELAKPPIQLPPID